jgi:hypothetical protein
MSSILKNNNLSSNMNVELYLPAQYSEQPQNHAAKHMLNIPHPLPKHPGYPIPYKKHSPCSIAKFAKFPL